MLHPKLCPSPENVRLFPNRALGGKLAVDLCGTVIRNDFEGGERKGWMTGKADGDSLPVADAIEVLSQLAKERFGSSIFFISQASPIQQARCLKWMKKNDIYERTGITRECVYFHKEMSQRVSTGQALSEKTFTDEV